MDFPLIRPTRLGTNCLGWLLLVIFAFSNLATAQNQTDNTPEIDLGQVELAVTGGFSGAFDFSPDGSKVLVCKGYKLCLIDCFTGRLIKEWADVPRPTGNPWRKGSAAFSFSPDASIVAVRVKRSDRLELYDIVSGKLLEGFTGKSKLVGGVIFSNDGQFVISGSKNDTAIIWEVKTGRIVRRLELGFEPADFQFSNDDGLLAILGGGAHELRGGRGKSTVWSTTEWKKLYSVEACRRAMALSGNGSLFASAHGQGLVKIWNANTLEMRPLKTEGWGASLEFNADASKLIVGNTSGDAILYDTQSGKKLLELGNHL